MISAWLAKQDVNPESLLGKAVGYARKEWPRLLVYLYTRNVKRWRGGSMIQRWVASALVEAEGKFRRVRGYRGLQKLYCALDELSETEPGNVKVA